MDNRDMRLPSHLRLPVGRGLVLRTVFGVLLLALLLVPAAGAAPGDRGVFVSKGVGRQIFIGGSGVAYGVVYSGGTLIVEDYSPGHDVRVDTPVTPTTNADGSRTYVPAGGQGRVAFRISGSLYRVTVLGSSTFNAAGIFGRLQLRGKGTLTVNGARSRWNGPAIKIGRPPKDVKALYQLAVSGQPPPVAPAPTPTTPTTTG
jgi:hypothetical protein